MEFRKGIFKCDVCGISLDSITIVNGMHFCAKCYHKTFGNMKSQEYLQLENNNKDHKIAVLERALELACKEVLSGWCSDYCGRGMNCNDCHYKKISSTDYFKSQSESDIKNEKEGV